MKRVTSEVLLIHINRNGDIHHKVKILSYLNCGKFARNYIYCNESRTMKIIFLLIIISLFLALGFLFSFLWAVRNGQYDDDYTPSMRILFDDEETNSNK